VNPDILNTQQGVDSAFMFIFWISLLFLAGITVAMIYFVIRYHHSREPRPTSDKDNNVLLEITWTVIPTLLVGAMFWYGWAGYLALRNVPEGAMEVAATARMWSWNFEYPNGRTSPKLIVPAGRPVKVSLTSLDVLHSFYVPAFRVKRDAVPGMDNYVWFNAERPGSYDIFCAEYCGVGHADMLSTVEALPGHEFEEWYQGKTATSRQDRAKELLGKYGCLGCHSLDGSKMVGPSLQGIWQRETVVLTEGGERTIISDGAYIRRSILEPGAYIVKGYPPIMPSFKGQISEDELNELLEAFQAEANPQAETKPQAEAGEGAALAASQGCLGCHSTDGSPRVGPSFKGLFGSRQVVLKNGQKLSLTADRDFLLRSIKDPASEVAEGFQPLMPPYPALTNEQLDQLLDYLESLQ
jgi:cytochrome c oxidase subunit II